MKRSFTFTLILMMIAVMTAQAQLDTADTTDQNFTFSLAGQNTNSIVGLTGVQPIGAINGHAGVFVSRQTAEDEVVSENVDVELVGGGKYLELFFEGKRDLHRGITWESSVGYFVKPPALTVGSATFTAGAGNSSANTQVKEALKVEGDDAVAFNWIAFVQVDWWKTETTITAEPDIRFESVQVEAETSIAHSLDAHFAVGATVKGIYDSHPVTDGKTHSQYLVFAKWTR